MSESIDFILTEMEDWGRALLAEHERRTCDVHGPVVPSKNTGDSIVRYAERLREALNVALLAADIEADPLAATRPIPPTAGGANPYPNGHTHPSFVGCWEAMPPCPKYVTPPGGGNA